jgi:hypothetical protein
MSLESRLASLLILVCGNIWNGNWIIPYKNLLNHVGYVMWTKNSNIDIYEDCCFLGLMMLYSLGGVYRLFGVKYRPHVLSRDGGEGDISSGTSTTTFRTPARTQLVVVSNALTWTRNTEVMPSQAPSLCQLQSGYGDSKGRPSADCTTVLSVAGTPGMKRGIVTNTWPSPVPAHTHTHTHITHHTSNISSVYGI